MDEMRDRPKRARRLLEYPFDVDFDRHVALQRRGLAARLFDGADHARRRVGVAVVINRHIVAALAGKPGTAGTDAAASAGNQQHGSRHRNLLQVRRVFFRRLRRASTLSISTMAAKAMAE